MISEKLNENEKKTLLSLARVSIINAVNKESPMQVDVIKYSRLLQENGASFVTLTKGGQLRGCIGTLDAYRPLVQDVCEHAAAAALSDYRFPPVTRQEVSNIAIEISRLTSPEEISYDEPEDILKVVRPGSDGVLIHSNFGRATFLPQVWGKLPKPEQFFTHLCQKMGAPGDLWRHEILQVSVYQVEEFSEGDLAE